MTDESLFRLIISILATLASPLVAIWVSETYIRRKNWNDTQRKNILGDLIANRYKVNSDQFLQAFNSIILYWGRDDCIKKLVFEFRNAPQDKKSLILTEIIFKICNSEGINYLSREDILNVFQST